MKKILFFAFAALTALASCNKEPKSGPSDGFDPDLTFTVINKPVTVGWEADSKAEISVRGNVEWSAEITSGTGAALMPGCESGSDNGTVTAVFTENEADDPRQITITISTAANVEIKSYTVTVTQKGKVEEVVETYVRVDRNLIDWSGEYILLCEGLTTQTGTYGGSTVLLFDGSGGGTDTTPLDGPGNILVLSPTSPGTHDDLAAITGADVEKIGNVVTISGGEIKTTETNAKCRLIIEAVEGGYSIKTVNGYYIGGGGGAGTLSASKDFDAIKHTHTISIGETVSSGTTFTNSAIIVSSATGANNTLRVNAGPGRFGYWPGANQLSVALYKLNLEESEYAEEDTTPVFTVESKPLTAGWQADSKAEIAVKGNVDWNAEITSGTGASLTPASGSGNGTVTVTFTENSTYDPREVKVVVSTSADVETKSFEITITQNGQPEPTEIVYVRVDETPTDWTGEYLIVYEAQAAGGGAFGAKTVLAFNGYGGGAGNAPVEGANNIVLSPATPGTPEDLAEITGGVVTRTATDITVTGGEIKATADLNNAKVIIEAVEGGYSIKTVNDYYLGGGSNGTWSSNKTFDPAKHINTIAIGDTDSSIAGNEGVTFHKCAIITTGSTVIRVNANTGRFGYWGYGSGSSFWGQHPVALYKLSE